MAWPLGFGGALHAQQLVTDPNPLDVTIGQRAVASDTLVLTNNSSQVVNYEVLLQDTTVANPGGVYQWRDSDAVGGPAYAWNDISGTGTHLSSVSSMDDGYEDFALSFSFPFYGTSFDTVYVGSNGYVTFGNGSGGYTNTVLPSTGAPANLIAAFFDDLNTGTAGDVYYLDTGTECIIQFEQVALHNGSGNATFQIVLKDSGEIVLYYNSLTGILTNATVGIQNAAKNQGVQIAYNQAYLKNNFAVKLVQNHEWLTMSPLSGSVGIGLSVNLAASFDAGTLAPGLYEGNVRITHDLVGEPVLDTPVSMEIDPGPSVTLTSPQNGFQFLEGDDIQLTAVATDNSGIIAKVEFYQGSTKLHELTSGPFTWTWATVPAGNYSITARAYDNLGGSNTSVAAAVLVDSDSDTDGLGDSWENTYFYGLYEDGTGDYDGDGVSDLIEYQLGLTPNDEDSDDDGMTDGEEYTYGLQPLVNDSFDDEDGDRYPNIYEVKNGADPSSALSKPTPHYVVNPGGGGTHTTIQSALTAASNTYTDYKIIQVAPGIYTGTTNTNLTTGYYKPLLISSQGAAKTVLDCQSLRRGITTYSDGVIDGFTFKNGSNSQGAAVYNSYADLRLVNCVFLNNAAGTSGGVLYNYYGNVIMVHSTATGNSAATEGQSIHVQGGTVTLSNSILWNAPGTQISIGSSGGGSASATYSIIRGGYAGAGNVSLDPLLTRDGHMGASSPALNAGDVVNAPNVDMDGEARPTGASSDIGADEWIDTDSDTLPDWWEMAQFGNLAANASSDPDGDGLTNVNEYIFGTSPVLGDADGDGANDGAEFAAGSNPFAADTDLDAIPDGYEITNGLNPIDPRDTLDDKDGDRIPNYYEYIRGTAAGNPASTPATDVTVDPAIVTETATIKKTIANAIAAAKTASGDCKIIFVKKGTYAETNLALNTKRIMLMGERGHLLPEIASPTASVVANITYQGVVLDSLVIRHSNPLTSSRGVYVGVSGTLPQVRLVNCIIAGNAYGSGSGIYVSQGECFVDHCTIARNTEATDTVPVQATEGLGIYVYYGAKLRLRNSIVWNPTTVPGSTQVYKYSTAVVETINSIVLNGDEGGTNVDPLLDRWNCLLPGSPAINPVGGGVLPGLTADIHGETRTSPADLGADEFVDTDADTLADWWEKRFIGNLTANGTANPDADGLTHYQEYLFGSNPTAADADSDGANDAAELAAGTDPWDADSDDDGINDGYEIAKLLNPLNYQDALEDKDGDRFPNIYEATLGTDANNIASVPAAHYTVAASGGTHTTITAAIAAAKSAAGDCKIILVKKGTYVDGNLSLNTKRIMLLGEQNAAPPTVATATTSPCLVVGISGIVVDGLVLTHTGTTGSSGATVSVSGHRAQARFVNCIITGNLASSGGGISLSSGELLVDHCTIFRNRNNTWEGEGGSGKGIYVSGSSKLRLRNSIVWNPTVTPGATQIYNGSNATCEVSNSIVLGGEQGGLNSDPLLDRYGFLKAGSPAINPVGGISVPGQAKDIDGTVRTVPHDIGVDEYADTDSDGLPDWWEMRFFSNLTAVAAGNTDADGLTNAQEYAFGSNPAVADTDGDGANDLAEFTAGTDPWVTDTDRDAMTDGYEITNGLNPIDRRDALEDKDGDRIPNVYEFVRSTVASNPASKSAPDYTVAATGGTHTTIAAAIAAAKSAVGDCKIILIKKGTWAESGLALNTKRILLLGEQGWTPPVISSTAATSVINMGIDGSAVDGLIIRHASPTLSASGVTMSLANYYDQVRIANCFIRDNATSGGAGIYLSAGQAMVDHCTIIQNQGPLTSASAVQNGVGIYLGSNSTLRLRNSIVWNVLLNAASTQIYKSGAAVCEVTGSIVRGGEEGGLATDPLLNSSGHVRPASPAVNPVGGISLSTTSTDIHGEVRTNPPDIGADEFVDSDSDGMADLWEIQYFTNLTKTASGDNDLPAPDGLSNLYEYLFEFDPTKPDTDGDGVSDLLEAYPLVNSYYGSVPDLADDDGDGLTNAQETLLGTSSTTADTNGDGIPDGASWAMNFNPVSTDSDGDGLTNAQEAAIGTSPLVADSDGDGVSDATDKFPLDPTQTTLPAVGGDITAPAVTLTKPPGATLLP